MLTCLRRQMDVYQNPHVLRELVDRFDESSARLYVGLMPSKEGQRISAMGTNCTSCHLNAGTVADGSPYVDISAFFPSYAPRAGRMITLEDRIHGCFRRSMNGSPLAVESADMKAMVVCFDWMKKETKHEDKVAGRGVGKIDMAINPDRDNGRRVYEAQRTGSMATTRLVFHHL